MVWSATIFNAGAGFVMARGNDTRDHPSRRPIRPFRGYRHMDPTEDIGNVTWVNFENPTEFHPKVQEYIMNVAKERAKPKNSEEQ